MSLLPCFLKEFEIGGQEIKIEQEGSVGIGGMVWDAAIVLAKFLAKHKGIYKGVKRVLELGSGTGLCGAAVAMLNPDIEVVITDQRSHLGLIMTNIQINNLFNAKCEELDWFTPQDLGKFDMIIGTDLVYEPVLFEPLLNTIDLCSDENTKIIMCHEVRRKRDLNFYKAARAKGWTVTIFPQELCDDEYRSPEVPIMRFHKHKP